MHAARPLPQPKHCNVCSLHNEPATIVVVAALLCEGLYHPGASGKALRIAVDQPRPRITNMAFLENGAAQCTVLIHAWNAVLNENEPRWVRTCADHNSSKSRFAAIRSKVSNPSLNRA
jgi:hypothetical protein